MGSGKERTGDQTKAGKYLTFSLGEEEYGVSILKIREIIRMIPITSVPRTPEFVRGVINLRGKIIPVIDLRLKFGMKAREYNEMTCIIVVDVEGSSGSIQMGVIVDKVSEVSNIGTDQIEETPIFGARLDTRYMLGMAKMGDRVKILLNMDKVLSAEEMAALNEVA